MMSCENELTYYRSQQGKLTVLQINRGGETYTLQVERLTRLAYNQKGGVCIKTQEKGQGHSITYT